MPEPKPKQPIATNPTEASKPANTQAQNTATTTTSTSTAARAVAGAVANDTTVSVLKAWEEKIAKSINGINAGDSGAMARANHDVRAFFQMADSMIEQRSDKKSGLTQLSKADINEIEKLEQELNSAMSGIANKYGVKLVFVDIPAGSDASSIIKEILMQENIAVEESAKRMYQIIKAAAKQQHDMDEERLLANAKAIEETMKQLQAVYRREAALAARAAAKTTLASATAIPQFQIVAGPQKADEVVGEAVSEAIDEKVIRSAKQLQEAYAAGQRDFRGYRLSGVNLKGMALNGSDFSLTNCEAAIFEGAGLEDTSWEGAKLTAARFNNAKMMQSNLSNADARRAHFDGADLTDAVLNGVNTRAATFTTQTTFQNTYVASEGERDAILKSFKHGTITEEQAGKMFNVNPDLTFIEAGAPGAGVEAPVSS